MAKNVQVVTSLLTSCNNLLQQIDVRMRFHGLRQLVDDKSVASCQQTCCTEQKINRRVIRVGTFEVCVPTHVALRMFIMQVLASQLHFQANRNAELAIPPLFWPGNCIKIGRPVALLSDPTVYSLYCACCKLIAQTCYQQACCKLFQQVVTSVQMTNCNKPDFNKLVSSCFNKL